MFKCLERAEEGKALWRGEGWLRCIKKKIALYIKKSIKSIVCVEGRDREGA